jgi:hypothetical protein
VDGLVFGLKMVTNFGSHPRIKRLAAPEANLHCWILSLYILGHRFGVELFVLVSVAHKRLLTQQPFAIRVSRLDAVYSANLAQTPPTLWCFKRPEADLDCLER